MGIMNYGDGEGTVGGKGREISFISTCCSKSRRTGPCGFPCMSKAEEPSWG